LWQISSAQYPQGQTTTTKPWFLSTFIQKKTLHIQQGNCSWIKHINGLIFTPYASSQHFFILHVGTRPHAGDDLGKA
jgi:hypothetical protein